MEDRFKVGDIVSHFKRELLSESEWAYTKKYLYEIIAFATHTETEEKCVVYRSLDDGNVFVRPFDMFNSEVDKEKYPDIKQKYRLEIYE